MKDSRRGSLACKSRKFLKGLIFASYFLLLPFNLIAREMDCQQLNSLIGFSLALHRIDFEGAKILAMYQQSIALTLQELDAKRDIFDLSDLADLTSIRDEKDIKECLKIEKINLIYSSKAQKPVAASKVFEMMAQNILNRMDPHSNFFSKREWASFEKSTKGKMKGIGISFQIVDGFPVVKDVYKGGPAENVLLPGDVILEIDGIKTKDKSTEDLLNVIGSSSDILILQIKRNGNETLIAEIEKKEFKIASVDWKFLDMGKGILYLSLSVFSEDASKEVSQALEEAGKVSTIRGLILDLRFNPGGMVLEAKKIAGIFTENTLVTSLVGKNGKEEVLVGEIADRTEHEAPMAILTNTFSASASELLSLALKDYGRALTVGTRTFGKGTGQSVFAPNGLSQIFKDTVEFGLALTTFQYYSPLGNSPQRCGVKPDIEIADPELNAKMEKARVEARQKGKKTYFMESEYDNAMPENKIAVGSNIFKVGINDAKRIVEGIESELRFPNIDASSIIPSNDIQLKKAFEVISIYSKNCQSFRENSCSFGGGGAIAAR